MDAHEFGARGIRDRPTSGSVLITAPQAHYLGQLCRWAGISKREISQLAGVRSFNRITMASASQLIDQLKNKDGDLMRRLAEMRGQLPLFRTE